MALSIVKYPDPILSQLAEPVIDFDKTLHQLLEEMAEAMYEAEGVGLAAPQIGVSQRIFVIDLGLVDDNKKGLKEFINPQIVASSGNIAFEEGCLSLPGFTAEVNRKESVTLNYQDRHGKEKAIEAEGFFAVAIQHELDHINGKLFIDRLSPIKRRFMKRKIDKIIASGETLSGAHTTAL